jgi:hypothetical protein
MKPRNNGKLLAGAMLVGALVCAAPLAAHAAHVNYWSGPSIQNQTHTSPLKTMKRADMVVGVDWVTARITIQTGGSGSVEGDGATAVEWSTPTTAKVYCQWRYTGNTSGSLFKQCGTE